MDKTRIENPNIIVTEVLKIARPTLLWHMSIVFSKDIKAIYMDTSHLVKDKNSFINPLDKPNKDEKNVKERKIKSATNIKII